MKPFTPTLYPTATDHTGRRFGKLTVRGTTEGKLRWVCECDCGAFEIRTTKAVVNPANNADACPKCRDRKEPKEILEPTQPVLRKPPERGVCGKMKFKSESGAKQAARNRLKRGANCNKLRVYFCKPCAAWHLSSTFHKL